MKRDTLPLPVQVPNTTPHRRRRQRLIKTLGEGVVLLPTAHEAPRNGDACFPFRWDSHFYYLTGFREPEAVFAIVLGKKPRVIFVLS